MSIEIKYVTKLYDRQKALDKVSFNVNPGELVGFLGPNGAGKSTLMKIITGYIPASHGDIYVNGFKVTTDSVDIRREIGYLPENNPLYTDLYVAEFLEITAGFYRLQKPRNRVKEMIELTGLEREQHKKIGQLSKGYRQRVGLAQALIHDPSVLILDEPTSGLDPNQLTEIRGLISEISREKTVILSSHILNEIEAICKRVVIINQGKLVADNRLSELKKGISPGLQQVYVVFGHNPPENRLRQIPGISEAVPHESGWRFTSGGTGDIRPSIFSFAVESGLVILEMSEKQQNLENIFRQLTH
jgi:ABC-2 type transport system ATP-binding protein